MTLVQDLHVVEMTDFQEALAFSHWLSECGRTVTLGANSTLRQGIERVEVCLGRSCSCDPWDRPSAEVVSGPRYSGAVKLRRDASERPKGHCFV